MRTSPAPANPTRRTFRTLAATVMAGPVLLGVVLSFIVGKQTTDRAGNPVHPHAPGIWMYVVIVVLGVAAAVGVQSVGYRLPALSPSMDQEQARATALRAYQQSMILRFAVSESVTIVSIALVFAFHSNTVLPYLVAAVITEVLLAYHIWPSDSLISRVEQRLDRNGGRSGLAEALDRAA